MGLTCKICFESASSSGQQARVTHCGHVFCQSCATIWFRNEAACPVCRAFVGELSALISLYDQDAGVQVSPDGFSERGGDRYNKEMHGGEVGALLQQKQQAAEEDDVQVKFVLGRVVERWQQVMVERAKLKVQVAELEKIKQKLQGQVVSLHDENKLLKNALGLRAARRSQAPSWESEGYIAEISTGSSRPAAAAGRPPLKVEERLRANSWELSRRFSRHSAPVHGIAVNSTGSLVATASWDHLCRIYDVQLEEEIGVLAGHRLGLYAVKFSPVKRDVVGTVSSDQTCRLWNTETMECISVLQGHKDEVNGLSFKRGTDLLATASDDTTCIVWDAERGTAVTTFKGHRSTVYGVCFQPCGHLVATASFDYTAKLWDPRSNKDIQTLGGHIEDVIGVDIDDSGCLLATGSDDKTCRIWDLRMCSPLAVLQEHSGEVKRVVFSPYGRLLATTSGDKTVRLFDTSTFECLHILSSHTDHVFDAAWSPSAEYLVTASHDWLWKLWRPRLRGSSNNNNNTNNNTPGAFFGHQQEELEMGI